MEEKIYGEVWNGSTWICAGNYDSLADFKRAVKKDERVKIYADYKLKFEKSKTFANIYFCYIS